MSIRLARPFRASVAGIRTRLEHRERALFDLICSAGQLGYRLPDDDINLRHASGTKDPRKRLTREFPYLRRGDQEACSLEAWARAGNRLARLVVNELAARDSGDEYRALRVLLAYASIALAPDCVVPRDPLLRTAWKTVVKLFAKLFPSTVKPMGRLACVDQRRLAILQREAAAGLQIGRRASGQRPGLEGRRLAVDPQLMVLVGEALGKEVSPGYLARYLFYTDPGDHIWPHPDDPKYAVTVLICINRELPPDGSTGSAFLAYRPDGSVERYELAPGNALAVEPGLVHGREPLRRGERVVMLSIGLRLPSQDASAALAGRRG